jgi:hypothetical protein
MVRERARCRESSDAGTVNKKVRFAMLLVDVGNPWRDKRGAVTTAAEWLDVPDEG